MPTYDYECQKCGHRFEKYQPISEKPLTHCVQPKCKGKVKRLIGTGSGLLFKGSGFYITDYRSAGYQAAAKKESESTKPAAKKESEGAKPAAKTESKAEPKAGTSTKKAASKP